MDVGGTNIRFATLAADGRISHYEAWLTALYPGFLDALAAYRELIGLAEPLNAVAIAAAGPLKAGSIRMTNCPWDLNLAALQAGLPGARVHLLNDFEAAGHAVPTLGPEDLRQLGGSGADLASPAVVMGPGTGLGVALLTPSAHGWSVWGGEGGHVDLAPQGAREIAVLHQLQQMFGHVSIERVLSGPGLENLMLAIAGLEGRSYPAKPQADAILRLADNGDDIAAEAVSLFTGWLGAAAGNAALLAGARAGVYIAGGIVPKWGARFDARLFRHRFEAKGRMRDYLSPIPTWTITAGDLAFRGLARCLAVAQR